MAQLTAVAVEKKQILSRDKRLLRASMPQIQREDINQIRAAFNYALEAHRTMRRKSGEPYIFHPLSVAQIVAEEIGLGSVSIISAILHDVVEDTDISIENIRNEFGTKISEIIEGLTKISKVSSQTESMQAENFRKLLLTLADDVRVILIKIADRLHNMRTLDAMKEHKQLKIASETLFLYAPIAYRLGLYAIKTELEDLAMKYLEPDTYKSISSKLKASEKERDLYIKEFITPLRQELSLKGFDFEIFGRPKSIYSIWNKMKTKGVEFNDVYDIFAIRIIMKSAEETEKADCWTAYSLVTDLYRPNPDRLRDWISMSKSNGYEALHTTVMGPKGKWVEIQIRSERMNEIAEKGIAAHWKYKESSFDSGLDLWLKKIHEILANPEPDSLEFLDNIKLNLFSEEIYIFTPKGDLKILPQNATPVDLAFEIHTDIGLKCIGAKVNYKLMPLNHKMSNGDQVEIITSAVQKPQETWLDFVVTSKAQTGIVDFLKREKKEHAEKGKKILEKKFKKYKVTFNRGNLLELKKAYHQVTDTDLFSNIALGNIKVEDFNNFKIVNDKLIYKKRVWGTDQMAIDSQIKDTLLKNANQLSFGSEEENINYDLAHCCEPIPGDEIVAIITEGDKSKTRKSKKVQNDLEIHKTNCRNAIELMSKYGNRIVKTKWTDQHEVAFLTGLKITGLDEPGTIYRITKVISGHLKINIQSITIEGKDGEFEGRITLFVNTTTDLDKLIKKLKVLTGISSVTKIEVV